MLSVETRFGNDVQEIFVDPDAFQQLVRNLLANSSEASPFGGMIRIETGISGPREKSGAGKSGFNGDSYYELTIHNHGKPIAAQNVRKIFDPFFTTKTYGTGMGLTLSRKIVEDHHGSMSVRSDEDGTLFTVWLPVNNAEDEKERAEDSAPPRGQSLHGTESAGQAY
jgi:signal transduction histidine kinase